MPRSRPSRHRVCPWSREACDTTLCVASEEPPSPPVSAPRPALWASSRPARPPCPAEPVPHALPAPPPVTPRARPAPPHGSSTRTAPARPALWERLSDGSPPGRTVSTLLRRVQSRHANPTDSRGSSTSATTQGSAARPAPARLPATTPLVSAARLDIAGVTGPRGRESTGIQGADLGVAWRPLRPNPPRPPVLTPSEPVCARAMPTLN